ncbi:uncharacterized protein TNCV_2782331 [Trichonephila clavipes]|nr:uncharacterized protein TNCV_2782331 [Trichonephila clavipes]
MRKPDIRKIYLNPKLIQSSSNCSRSIVFFGQSKLGYAPSFMKTAVYKESGSCMSCHALQGFASHSLRNATLLNTNYKQKRTTSAICACGSTVKSLNDVRSQVKSAYQSNSAITDIDVTFDGTWLTRGHSSQIGVGCVIDLLTRFVMDFEIMSKRCIECEHAKSGLGENSAEFHAWYEGHISSRAINHVGSSCAIEQEAALKLWQRSEDSGFRYTTLLSDGDAKTYQYLNTKEVYCPEIKIKKEECINHVSKRLGTSLRKAVKEWRARGVSLGGKSRGSLKEETIKKMLRYYQNAIRSNKGDVEAMKIAIYAKLFHSISTDQKPQHFKCPTGKDSWCFFQAVLARGEVPGPHVKHVKTPLKETHLAKIMPTYQRLASNELLQRCIRCVTQNANESLHSIIWGKCSKETSATLRRVTIAVCDAVCEFNFEKIELREDLKSRRGLAVSLEIICHNCGESTSTMSSKISNKCYDVNLRLTYGMRAIGKGGAAARIFCGLMNLSPPPAKFERHNSLFLNVLKTISEDSMNAAVHEAVIANDNNSNIAVAVDGTWHKRGYSSLNGIVCATSVENGKWGNGMSGVLSIFQRSETSRKACYTQYLGDGDSKGFLTIKEAKVYGDTEVEKLECVGHVQKRMGTRLRNILKMSKGIKLSDGKNISGRGRLTLKEVDSIQHYYGLAIRKNLSSVEDMKRAIWAIYFHKLSTEDNPQHAL